MAEVLASSCAKRVRTTSWVQLETTVEEVIWISEDMPFQERHTHLFSCGFLGDSYLQRNQLLSDMQEKPLNTYQQLLQFVAGTRKTV